MNAKVCDRCGKFYLPYRYEEDKDKGNAVIVIDTQSNDWHNDHKCIMDLCKQCSEKLYKFLHSGKGKKNDT